MQALSKKRTPRIDRKLTAEARTLHHGGHDYRLTLQRGVWRIRRRSKLGSIDAALCRDLGQSMAMARDLLTGRAEKVAKRTGETLEALCRCYLDMPKRCGESAAKKNVGRLRAVVRAAWGKELDAVKLCDLSPSLWTDYQTKRLNGKLDLSTRRAGNGAINTAVRCARSIFVRKLRPVYKTKGLTFTDDIDVVQWLPVMKQPQPAADDAAMIEAWRDEQDQSLYFAIGLARFAGLRLSEIEHARGSWFVDGHLELRDRPDEGFLTKTGEIYRALVLDADLAERLRAMPADSLIVPRQSHDWFTREPQAWVRRFVGEARKPLHRLRGLYADHLAKLTADATAARLAGIQAASNALGHTSTATTRNHYLSGQ